MQSWKQKRNRQLFWLKNISETENEDYSWDMGIFLLLNLLEIKPEPSEHIKNSQSAMAKAFGFTDGSTPRVVFTADSIQIGCHLVSRQAWELLNQCYQKFLKNGERFVMQEGSY